jgi:perosamine synthetase
VLAALGCAQMEQLSDYVALKRRIAATYTEALADVPGITPPSQAPWAGSTFWLYTVLVDEAAYGMDSRALLRVFQSEGVQTRPLWHPLHRLPPFQDAYAYRIEVVDRLHRDALSLPCSVGLTAAQQARVIDLVRRFSHA